MDALDAGADDYVTKPFGMGELLARLRAALRRAAPTAGGRADRRDRRRFTVDLAADGSPRQTGEVRLTPTEWHLLEVLVRSPGRLVTPPALLQEVWGPRTRARRTTCGCTSPSCGASSSRPRATRVTSSPSPGSATASRNERVALGPTGGNVLPRPRSGVGMTSAKTWFITGASRGFGKEWASAALERGDTVAATARDPETLDDLVQQFGDKVLPLRLDVDDRGAVVAAVEAAHDRFGRLDVVVNNAGYGQFGMIEEISEAEARAQFDTNVFGALLVTQAALPYLRAQGSGRILQVSSIGGVSAFPNIGIDNASKLGV